MTVQNNEIPAPPGVIASLKSGFDAVASNITVILLPLLLDVLFWLGPRLSLKDLFIKVQPEMIQIWKASGISPADVKQATEWYGVVITKINLFWLLRTLPIGISSLLMGDYYRALFASGIDSGLPASPLGLQPIWQVSSDANLLGWYFLLVLVGWLGGALYFRWVASLVVDGTYGMFLNTGRAITQTILFSIIWAVASWIIGLPILLVFSVLAGAAPIVAEVVFFIAAFLSMWVLVPVFFSIHGIFITRQNALLSIWNGLRMARFTMPNSSLFVLSLFFLGIGLNFLWSIPPMDSWATFIGIFGHSFVSTALLASSFVFYRDSIVWIQIMLDRFKSNPAFGKQQLK